MAKSFHLSVVAPDRSVVEEDIVSLVAPGSEGYFGVMADHVPLIASLRPGLLEFLDGTNQRHFVYVGGGFAEVRANSVTVLADEAQKATEIDVQSAENELVEARRALRGEGTGTTSEDAVQQLDRAMNRLRAARQAR